MPDDVILLADGGGGERMMDLVRREILSRFAPGDGSGELARLADAARLQPLNERYAPIFVAPNQVECIFRAAARYEKL